MTTPEERFALAVPRRFYVPRLTPAELAIRAAMQAVEDLPADTRLTKAVTLLSEAKDCVSDYVDGVVTRNRNEATT